jgi:hypothetical protein
MPREHTPDSKFQVRNAGQLMHPGSCLSCGSGTRQEGYIDLGTYFDYEGQMYLCAFCLEEAAEIFGMLSIAEAKFLREQSEKAALENEQLKEALTHANRRLRAYDDILDASFSRLRDSDVALEASDPNQPELDLNDSGDVTGSVSGESEPTESTESGSGLTGSARSASSDLTGAGITL